LSWNPQGQHTSRRGRRRKSWSRKIEEEDETVGKTWREVKAILKTESAGVASWRRYASKVEQQEIDLTWNTATG
jgi:hypothetical protein